MNSLVVPVRWIPKDSEEKRKYIESILDYHGFDTSKPYTEEYLKRTEEMLYSQELAKVENIIITGKLVL